MKKMARPFLMVLAAMTLVACDNQYIERKDTLTLGAGDAVATNMAAHIRDPWPPRSANDRIPMDGVKAGTALLRYRLGQAPGGGAPPSYTPSAPMTPGAVR